jgi:putative tryptophan/tyrosine transport system substrate-binding protein
MKRPRNGVRPMGLIPTTEPARMIDRRTVLAVAAALFAPTGAAQTRAKQPRVGILNFARDDDVRVRQFREALASLGYTDGQNLALVLRSANGSIDRLPSLAAALVEEKVDVILALGPAVWAAKQATQTIPIIIAFSGDPVGQGVVASLARPGGNLTGFTYMSTELAAKRLELASIAFNRHRRVGVLYNPREPATKLELETSDKAAQTLGVEMMAIAAETPDQLDAAFTNAVARAVDGLVVLTHGFAVIHAARIIALATSHRVPMLFGWREFATEGGLMSYGPEITLLVRQAAGYADRIIKGASPADLPVVQPTRFELVVNLRTAKALGLTLPSAILLRADEVIE